MSNDKEVTVTFTPEDAAFYARAKAAGVPTILISMYGKSLRRLIADEREECAMIIQRAGLSSLAAAIRARGKP
jgi:hypothetical protein